MTKDNNIKIQNDKRISNKLKKAAKKIFPYLQNSKKLSEKDVNKIIDDLQGLPKSNVKTSIAVATKNLKKDK